MKDELPKPLPALSNDPEVLQQMVREMTARLAEQDRRIAQLTHQLDLLLRRTFGPRAETIDASQLRLAFAELARENEEPVVELPTRAAEELFGPAPEATTIRRRRGRGHGRGRLPEHLPRIRIEHALSDAERVCPICRGLRKKIDEVVTEQLEFVPACLCVHEHVRFKYACEDCEEHIVLAPLPPQPIEKGLPGPGLISQVLTGKLEDNIPLHRQSGIFQRHGLRISPSTMGDWVRESAKLFEPLVVLMKRSLVSSDILQTDDTTVPVLDRARRHTRLGRLWTYVGDFEHPYTVYEYSPDRSGKHPQKFLEEFRGYLQADAYAGYDALYRPDPGTGIARVIEVGCMAHCRRKFFDAQTTDQVRSLATLAYIRLLYKVEKEARGLAPPARRALRQEKARPLLDELQTWLEAQEKEVLPKSPIGEAIHYALANWTALTRYLEDGRLEIDNNASERALRKVAVGRKAWTFAGSDAGGERAAVIYSLIESARRNGLDPFAYLRDLLQRLPSHSQLRLAELLPDHWTPAASK